MPGWVCREGGILQWCWPSSVLIKCKQLSQKRSNLKLWLLLSTNRKPYTSKPMHPSPVTYAEMIIIIIIIIIRRLITRAMLEYRSYIKNMWPLQQLFSHFPIYLYVPREVSSNGLDARGWESHGISFGQCQGQLSCLSCLNMHCVWHIHEMRQLQWYADHQYNNMKVTS